MDRKGLIIKREITSCSSPCIMMGANASTKEGNERSVLEEYKTSSNSLGLKVKTLIEAEIIQVIDQIEANKNDSEFCNTADINAYLKASSLSS